MARRKTGWQEFKRNISASFNVNDPDQRRAYEIIEDLRAGGRSIQSILTTAILSSSNEQFTTPTLGDEAANQIMLSVRELGELIENLRNVRLSAIESGSGMDDEIDYGDQVIAAIQNRKKK